MRFVAYHIFWIIIISCFVSVTVFPVFCSGAVSDGTNTYATLEDAVAAVTEGSTLELVSNTPVTFTPGNITAISKTLTFTQNTTGSGPYYLLVNGTIGFSGTSREYKLNTGGGGTQAFAFLYDPTGPAVFRNNSLIEVTGSSNSFTTDGGIHPSLSAIAFTGTGTNVTGSSNSFSYFLETKSITGSFTISNLSIVWNMSGSYNSISDTVSSPLNTQAAGGIGLNIIGNFNNQIALKSADTTSAPGGKIYISPSANGNEIKDASFNLLSVQPVHIYNGSVSKTTTSWYFFNSSWSPSGGNRDVTIAPGWSFPFSGNVSLIAGFSNVSGQSTDFVRNSSLTIDNTGKSSGILTNDTSSLKFTSISAVVPIGMSIGNNTFKDTGNRIVSSTGVLGSVTLLNFNPYNSLPGKNFNATATTNWSRIQDFSAAPNVTFVIENPATHAPLGNISFNQNIDLLDSTLISTGLQSMGQNLDISTTGNSTNLSVTSSGLSVFNKPATLTVYPTGFTFTGKRDINITVIPDGSTTPTTLFDHNSWINRAGYVDNSATVTVGTSFISLPVLHFSRYDFSPTTNTSPITISLGPGGDFSTLEEALLSAGGARENDTLSLNLNSDIYVTKTSGNVTFVDKTLNLTSNGNKILVNGTIQFNGTGKAWTYTDAAWFSYNNPTAAPIRNNSLIQISGSSEYFNGTMPTLDAGSFSGTGLNITGSSNTVNAMWNITGAASLAVNLTGSSNTISVPGNISTTAAGGIAINLLGNSNSLSLNSQNLSGPGGRIWIGPTATGNTISDSGFTVPNIYIYNGTSFKATTAWYFFNASWSPSGRNRNPAINVSQSIPLAGNVSLIGGFANVTGLSTDFARNTSPALSATGLAGGTIFNDTSALKFSSVSAVVPVNVSFGDNTFAGSYQQKSLGSVVVLNFNPVNSLSSKNFNVTRTTNWSEIPDFSAIHNLTFVIEDPATHTLLGNISYNRDLDLTDPNIGTGLSAFGSNLVMAAAGNSINLNIANTDPAFNKEATLTVYPTGFTYTSGADIKITATTDSGSSTVLYNNGVWLNRAGFVDANSNVSIGSGTITLPVLHFSKFDFDPASSSVSSTGGGGGGGYASVGAPSSGTGTVSVETRGGSAITMVEVTGVGVTEIIISAVPYAVPPSSISPPASAVYQYIEVTPDHYTEISNAIVNFSVQKSWLVNNGFTKNDVSILRNSNGVWIPLQTYIVGETPDFVNYQATTSGFSFYAIVYAKDAAIPVPTVTVNATATLIPVTTIPGNVTDVPVTVSPVMEKVMNTPAPANTVSENTVSPQNTIENSPTQMTPGFDSLIAIFAVIVVFAILWVSSRKNNRSR